MRLRPAEALGVPRGAGLGARPARPARVQDQPSLVRQPARVDRQAGTGKQNFRTLLLSN